MKLLNRRKFLNIFSKGNLIFICSAIFFAVVKFLNISTPSKTKIFKIKKKHLKHGINEFPSYKIAIIYKKNAFLVLDTTCTHLGCTVRWNKELNIFECPCHQSAFDITGRVLRPPAKKSLTKLKFKEKNFELIIQKQG